MADHKSGDNGVQGEGDYRSAHFGRLAGRMARAQIAFGDLSLALAHRRGAQVSPLLRFSA